MLDDWADRGRAGTVLIRELLERRPKGYIPPASNLEARFATLAERFGIGPFRRQVDLGGEAWIGRVDFRHEHRPLVVEVLSHEHHAALVDEATDERRFAALEEAKFTVESIWDHEYLGGLPPGDGAHPQGRGRPSEHRGLILRRKWLPWQPLPTQNEQGPGAIIGRWVDLLETAGWMYAPRRSCSTTGPSSSGVHRRYEGDELYDRGADPAEEHNMIERPDVGDLAASLRGSCSGGWPTPATSSRGRPTRGAPRIPHGWR